MTPYQRGDSPYYYVDLTLSDGRRLVRSTKETSKRRAQAIESTIREMDTTGRHDVLDALVDGEISPKQLHSAKLAGRVDDLMDDAYDPPLGEAVQSYLNYEPHRHARHGLEKMLEVAPSDARLSWARDAENLREVVAWYRTNDYAAGTERRQMQYLSKFLRHHFGHEVRDRLWRRVELRSQDSERCAWLTPDEVRAIQEIASRRMWVLIATAMATGLRLGELLALLVRDVDLEYGLIRVREGKSDAAKRKVPVGGRPLERLEQFIRERGLEDKERIWPDLTNNKVWHRWHRYRKHLGLTIEGSDPEDEDPDWFRFHDLRHHYAVYMARQGVPLTELRDLLGHSTLRMVERYAIYTPPPARDRYRRVLQSMGLEGPSAEEPQQMDQQDSDTDQAEAV